MFTIYAANHPVGLNANVATTAANKGVLLAIVAMAQTLVVLTSGIDLSVGMVMVLANCLASSIVVGSPLTTALGVLGVLLVGCAVRRDQRTDRHLRTSAADRHDDRHRRGLLRGRAGAAARSRRRRQRLAGRCADRPVARRRAGEPCAAAGAGCDRLAAVPALGDRTRRLCGRLVRGRGLHVGRADPPRQVRRLHAVGPARVGGRAVPHLHHLLPARRRPPTAAPTRCIRSPQWCWAACRCSAARAARSARSSAR